ncbi:MAG: potassium channel family protein [Sporolactobacillus sp.]|jgi:voltage-gated potassium channel|nr:potassium channel family protein [Sporolactobacillus sp.]
MKSEKKDRILFIYQMLVVVLALIPIVLVTPSFAGRIRVAAPGDWLINAILLFFAADYFIRFFAASNKKAFLIENSFDLLGIIPMHPAFALFRLARIVRILRARHIFVTLGINGKVTGNIHRFIYSTGFIYLFSISVVILVCSALLFSTVEHVSLSNALWWAVTTATTVGYGDIYPHTTIGKLIAALLMVGGIGFIGLLTSTITDFFTVDGRNEADTTNQEEIRELTRQIAALSAKVDRLSGRIDHLSAKRTGKK